ncbi:hypothetical protein JX265_008808 [Neoarthrinium moseri]|uniref:Uncharacterized protein n=1 Tax=Neoarthrinium moseri TaxID=1658444 RepID=A0A9P9WHI6_9PEZI|nr:hypothetical protein JX266_005716 [Neoarthrinium moseri]KAI1863591.1 hypothetical protein JX265_008808 [Neoarthrinium moseri]
MFFSKALVLAVAGTALAAPSGGIEASRLEKRGPETIHFADCVTYLAIDYYADDDNSNSFPGNSNECVTNSFREGSSGSCSYSTGVKLSYNLISGAKSKSANTYVGSANNSFKTFTCKRGSDRVLYVDGNGHACKDTYYCRP